jgi:hypothetical protein
VQLQGCLRVIDSLSVVRVQLQAKSPNGVRWHPLVIRQCLYVYSKSPAGYEAMRRSGMIVLPSGRTMRRVKDDFLSAPGLDQNRGAELWGRWEAHFRATWAHGQPLDATQLHDRAGMYMHSGAGRSAWPSME